MQRGCAVHYRPAAQDLEHHIQGDLSRLHDRRLCVGLAQRKELARVNDSAYSVYLIRKGQQDIGYLTIHQADGVTLQSLYIVSEYQRNGIGRGAFDLVRAYCREHGAQSFICHCVPENHNARMFYERMGGTVIGEDLTNEESW